tara:strand:+ start:4637 stop:5581 length:945 start_codon:yes stop_codon:yes gene_type:complete
MYLIKKLKNIFIILSIITLNIIQSIALENKILFKVEDEIITSIDIYEEIEFLKIFNPEINNLEESELLEISKNSILKDKIKKIEIMNFVEELKVDDKFLIRLIKSKYSRLNIDSIEKFENYLKDNDLNVKKVKEKFTIELIWNDLIFQKFNKKIVIDKDRIRKEILENPQRKQIKELLLSEIIFNASNKNEYLEKYEKILFDIEKSGFKKAALIHSNSESSANGGIVGWVKEDNLNKNIRKVISKLQIKQISKPIRTSSGFIIIMIEDKRVSELKFNLAEKIDETIRFKRNDQLNQFSNIYFNKLKKDLIIYGL